MTILFALLLSETDTAGSANGWVPDPVSILTFSNATSAPFVMIILWFVTPVPAVFLTVCLPPLNVNTGYTKVAVPLLVVTVNALSGYSIVNDFTNAGNEFVELNVIVAVPGSILLL